ncbi:DUF4142 domain-containing protein [Brevundimonas naejangsanensis]|nr:DUF4142 domain-containing protein [Brevundimonas naejangsanensis]
MTLRHAPIIVASVAGLLPARNPQGDDGCVDKAQDAVSAPVDQTFAAMGNTILGYAPGAAMSEIRSGDVAPERARGLLDNLRSAGVGDFDRLYIDRQASARQEVVVLNRGFTHNTAAPPLTADAPTAPPKVEHYLRKAREIQAAI